MSYIKHKERVFHALSNGGLLKKSKRRSTSVTPCTDKRAWALNDDDQRTYFIETISNSNNEDRFVPIDVIIEILLEQKNEIIKELEEDKNKKRIFNEFLMKQNYEKRMITANKPDRTDNSTNTPPENVPARMNVEVLKTEPEEFINLRSLVKDLREQVIHLESVKYENIMLKSELQVDIKEQLADALAENNHLASELEACQDLVQKYNNLKECNDELKNECKELTSDLSALKGLNSDLKYQLKEEKDKLNDLKEKRMAVTTAVAEREILVDKVYAREEKISFLSAMIEDQERQIHELTWQLEKLTANYKHKEERLVEKLEDAKKIAMSKREKLEEYELKLENAEALITELYSLRNQFRITNASLSESSSYYKNQFDMLSTFSLKMITTIKELQNEIFKKNVEIKKLSVFPQSGKTIVYFAQLNGLLSRNNLLVDSDPEHIKDLIQDLKHIVSQLKVDLWGDADELPVKEIMNAYTQCYIELREVECQFDKNTNSEKYVQTCPDESAMKIENLKNMIKRLQENVSNEQLTHHRIEEKLVSCVQAKAACEFEVSQLKYTNDQLKQKVICINQQLSSSNILLGKALDEIEMDVDVRDSTSELFNSTLESTMNEYLKYITTLENYINLRENNVEELNEFISVELNEKTTIIRELEDNLETLRNAVIKEKDTNTNLLSQLMVLVSKYTLKENEYNEVKEKLDKIELLTNDLEDFITAFCTDNDTAVTLPKETVSYIEESHHLDQLNKISRVLSQQNNYLKTSHIATSTRIKSLTESNTILKRVIKKNRLQNKDLKNKIIHLKINVKRVTKFIKKLHRVFKLTENNYLNLRVTNQSLNDENESLRFENSNLLKDIESLNLRMCDLGVSLQVQEKKEAEQCEENEKLQRTLSKVMKKLEKYKRIVTDEENNSRGQNEFESVRQNLIEVQKLNLGLTCKVDELKQQFSEVQLFANSCSKMTTSTQVGIEDLLEQPFNCIEQSVQVDFEDVSRKHFEVIISEMKNEYESNIKKLKNETALEREEHNRQYVQNLTTLKETYERDINRSKQTHSENLMKMQMMHEEELKHYKELKEEGQINMASVEENYNKRIEILNREFKEKMQALNEKQEREKQELKEDLEQSFEKEYQEKLSELQNEHAVRLEEQEKIFMCEKARLEEEMEKEMSEKNSEIKSLHEKMASDINALKLKCKQYIQKSQERHKNNIEKMKAEFMHKYDKENKNELRKKRMNNLTITKTEQFEVIDFPIRDTCSLDKLTCKVKNELRFSSELDDSIMDKLETTTRNIIDIEMRRSFQDLAPTKDDYGKTLEIVPIKGSNCGDGVAEQTKNSVLWDKSYLINRVSELESELLMKDHEMEKNVKMMEKRVKEEHMKLIEVASLLDFEMKHSAEVQRRLGAEFERAELVQSEKESLQRHIAMLEKKTHHAMEMADVERATSFALKMQLENTMSEQKNVKLLEASISRLRAKLDRAIECEQKLSGELRNERERSEKLEAIVKIQQSAPDSTRQNQIEEYCQFTKNYNITRSVSTPSSAMILSERHGDETGLVSL